MKKADRESEREEGWEEDLRWCWWWEKRETENRGLTGSGSMSEARKGS